MNIRQKIPTWSRYKDNNVHCKYNSRYSLFLFTQGSLPQGLLEFSLSSDCPRLKLPDHVDVAGTQVLEGAFVNWEVNLHESLLRTTERFKSFGVKVGSRDVKDNDVKPTHLNSKHIAWILNSPHQNTVLMHSNVDHEKTVQLKGRMLLYGLCQVYNCKITLFSTRSKPVKISPIGSLSDALPSFYLLEHKDSYAGKVAYYHLKPHKKCPPNNKAADSDYQGNQLVARKREAEEKKQRKPGHNLGNKLDDTILHLISEESNKLYLKKWKKYKKGKSLDDFRATLSLKQIPTGVIPVVKAEVEEMLRNNVFDGFTAEDIPKAGTWMNQKVDSLKKRDQLSVATLLDNFFKKHSADMTIAEEDATIDAVELPMIEETQVDDSNDSGIRTISKTLKGVINKDFDYAVLRDRLDQLQESTHSVITGLSKAVHVLIDILTTGRIHANKDNHNEFFQLSDLDFGGFGVGKDEHDIFLPSQELLNSLQKDNVFSYPGFWTIMSRCIGKKNEEKRTM